jgi:site-specific DNA-methyltransferase (adenine-specific)
VTLLKGNCLDTLKTLPDCSVDSIVTDPPYELGFMGKSWDNSGIAYSQDLWVECLRVLKPGGHLLAFSGSRTYHRMVVAIEDAGFEVRDQIMWLYGSGFPKSLDVSKAIDKAAGAKRKVIGSRPLTGNGKTLKSGFHQPDGSGAGETIKQDVYQFTEPTTPKAQQWQGWGTALKPAHEPICVARKPLIGTVANNVLTYGTGALNIDGSRVGEADGFGGGAKGTSGFSAGYEGDGFVASTQGRWPANVIHDGSDEVLEGFPITAPSKAGERQPNEKVSKNAFGDLAGQPGKILGHNDNGGSAGRFFYCAKANKSERNAGLEGLEEKAVGSLNMRTDAHSVKNGMETKPAQNFHPTVKPLALMRYLVKLVTPPNGVVLDPFLGSGSTAVAAILEGFDWIGCEMTEDYWPIIEARVTWAHNQPKTML